MDRLDQFVVFQRVVECASFTRAADTLGLPRSTVSAAIRQLEQRLGTRLLARNTRHVAPTRDGDAFYQRCRELVADVEEAEGLFRTDASTLRGVVRAELPGRIGRLIVAPALPRFLDRHPEVSIELGVGDRTVDLIEDRVDCAVRVGPLRDSGLIARPVAELALINVASPAYLRRHGTPRTPEDLGAHFAVGYASPTTGRVEAWDFAATGAPPSSGPRRRVTVNSAEAYIACCEAGLGLIQIPAYDVAPQLARRALVEVLPEYRPAPLPMTLLYPQRRGLSPRVRAFADWLVALLQRACGTVGTPAPAPRFRAAGPRRAAPGRSRTDR